MCEPLRFLTIIINGCGHVLGVLFHLDQELFTPLSQRQKNVKIVFHIRDTTTPTQKSLTNWFSNVNSLTKKSQHLVVAYSNPSKILGGRTHHSFAGGRAKNDIEKRELQPPTCSVMESWIQSCKVVDRLLEAARGLLRKRSRWWPTSQAFSLRVSLCLWPPLGCWPSLVRNTRTSCLK